MRDALKRVPGVGDVLIFGERKYAMRVWLDPARLAARGVTAGDVVSALREQNVQVSAGALGDAPADPNQAYNLSVRVRGRLTEPLEFENVVVKAGKDGCPGARDATSAASSWAPRRTRPTCASSGSRPRHRHPAAAERQRARRVPRRDGRDGPARARASRPGSSGGVAFDNVGVVRESIKEVLVTLVEAIALVLLVMFLFLQNWRSTLIPAITIPVSLIGTFAFVKLFGFSINTLTLFGIVLATGIVVDDAIVVIENIERHMREDGKAGLPGGDRRDGRGDRRGDRDRPGAGGGVRAGVLLPGHDRAALPAVLADDRVRRGAVGLQRGDASRPRCPRCCWTRRATATAASSAR